MATEKRLIDAQALIQDAEPYLTWDMLAAINNADTVEAVEIVRCKECFGRSCWEKDENGCDICWVSGMYVRGEDDFCSFGERKEGADNG